MSFFKENWKYLVLSLAITITVSYGISDFLNIVKSFCLFYSVNIAGYLFYKYKTRVQTEDSAQLAEVFAQFEGKIEEQEDVINQYEEILDTQFVTFRCDCGSNLFNGFLPSEENLIECEKCGSSYKIIRNFTKILISEPLEGTEVIETITKVSENIH